MHKKFTEKAKVELKNRLGISEEEVLEIEQVIRAMIESAIDNHLIIDGDSDEQ